MDTEFYVSMLALAFMIVIDVVLVIWLVVFYFSGKH